MELQALILSVLLLSIVSGVEPKSVSTQCAIECTEKNFFQYQEGYDYIYSYDADVISSFHKVADTDQKTKLSITSRPRIRVRSKCELELMFDNIQIHNQERSVADEWAQAITQNNLRFSWQDGSVPTICSEEEETWVLNFKRGFLSTLQTSSVKNESSVQETDVSGECEASYTSNQNQRGNVVITKRKDYSKCTDRDKHMLFSYFTPFTSESPRQNFIFSEQSCENEIQNGVIQSLDCSEAHVLRPFSNDENGARTNIEQRVRLLQTQRSPFDATRYTSLIQRGMKYEEIEVVDSEESYDNQARTLMSDICSTYESEHYDVITSHFTSLVNILSKLDHHHIEELYSMTDTMACDGNEHVLREMIIDAVPFCYTEGCVMFATDLIRENTLSESISKRWLMGFSFSKYATTGMVDSVMSIISESAVPKAVKHQAYLTSGALINSLCTSLGHDKCSRLTSVQEAVNRFVEVLGNNCRTPNPETIQDIISALRGLGNAGVSSYNPVVDMCIEEIDNAMEVRIAAVQTYRRKPCYADRSKLEDIFFSPKEDSEMRIAAYVALMQCPTDKRIRNIVSALEVENSQQVASFIWSHMNELKSSTDPLKYYIQQYLKDADIKAFELDPTKFSRFYEASVFSEQLNAGVTVDSSLVWSPKSFIPRSGMVNLTLDVFGQAVNLFEIGGRVEGIEGLLQQILEPEIAEKKLNRRRIVDNSISEIDRQYKDKVTNERNAMGSGYLRVFGNELAYMRTDFKQHMQTANDKKWLRDFASKFMTPNGYSYHDDSILLNSVHKIPTGVGFPMTVAFNGSTSVDLTAKGNFQLPRGSGIDISGKFNPRAAVVIRSAMTIDAHVTESGISTESVAMTSSQVSASLNIDSDKNVEFSIDTPYNKNKIMEIKHTLLAVRNGEVSEMVSDSLYYIQKQESTSCTNEYAGQQVCYFSSYNKERSYTAQNAMASPLFPMDGQFEMSLEVQKTDPSLTHYLFTTQTHFTKQDGVMFPPVAQFDIVMDTPLSTINRKTTLHLSYNIPDQEVFAQAERFGVVYNVQGNIRNTDAGKEMSLNMMRGEDIFSFVSTYKKSVSGFRREWSLETSVKTPSKSIQSTGNLIFEPGTQATFDFNILNLNADPIQIKLDLQDNSKNENKLIYSGEGVLKIMPFVNTGFNLGMTLRPKINNLFLDLQYSFGSGLRQSILLNHKRKNRGTATTTDWEIAHKFTSTQFDFMNHDILIGQTTNQKLVESNVEISYGANYEDEKNSQKLQMSQSLKDSSVDDELRYNANWKLSVPYTNIDHEMEFVFANSDELLNAKLSLNPQRQNGHVLELSFEDHSRTRNSLNKRLYLNFPTPWGNVLWDNQVVEAPVNVYTMHSSTSLGESTGLSFTGETTLQLLDSIKSVRTVIKNQDNDVILEASSENRYSLTPLTVSSNNVFNVGQHFNSFDFTLNEQTAGYESEVILKKSRKTNLQHESTFRFHALTTKTDSGRNTKLTLQNNETDQPEKIIVAKTGCGNVPDSVTSAYATISKNSLSIFDLRYQVDGQIVEPAFGSASISLDIPPVEVNYAFSGSFDTRNGIQARTDYNVGEKTFNVGFEVPQSMSSIDIRVRQNVCDKLNNIELKLAKVSDTSATLTYIERSFAENSAVICTKNVVGNLGESEVTATGTCRKGTGSEYKCMDGSLRWGTFSTKGDGVALVIENPATNDVMRIEHYYDNQLKENTDMYYAARQVVIINCQKHEINVNKDHFVEFKKMETSVALKSIVDNHGVYATGSLEGKELSVEIVNNATELIKLGVPTQSNVVLSVSDNIYGSQSARFFIPDAEISLNANHAYTEASKSWTSRIQFDNTLVGWVGVEVPNQVIFAVTGNGELPHSSSVRVDVTELDGRNTQSASFAVNIDTQASSFNFNHNVPALRSVPQSIAADYSFQPERLQASFNLGRKRLSLDGNRGKGRIFATLENTNMIESAPSNVRSDVRYSVENNAYKFNSLTTLYNSKNYKLNLLYSHVIEEDSITIKTNLDSEFDGKILAIDSTIFNSAEKFSIDWSGTQNVLPQFPRKIAASFSVLMGEEKGVVVSYSLNGRKTKNLDFRHSSEDGTVFGNVSFKHNNDDLPVPKNFRLKMVTENQDDQKTIRAILSQPRQNDKTVEISFSGPLISSTSSYFSASFNHDFEEAVESIGIPQRASISTLYSNSQREMEITFGNTWNDASFSFEFNFIKATKSVSLTIHNNGIEQLYTFEMSHNLSPNLAKLHAVLSMDGEEHVVYLSASQTRKFMMEEMQLNGNGALESVVKVAGNFVSFNISGNFNDRIWQIEERYDENLTPYGLKGVKTLTFEKTADFDYKIAFGDDDTLVISFDNNVDGTFIYKLTLNQNIPQLLNHLPSYFDEKLTKTIENNEMVYTYSYETSNTRRKTIKLSYDFIAPWTRSVVEFTHDCEEMNKYNIPQRVGFEFTQQLQNKRSNGQFTYNLDNKHATVSWNMPSFKEVEVSMTQTFVENVPKGSATITLLDNGARVTIHGKLNTAINLEFLQLSETAYQFNMNQNFIENMPYISTNLAFSPNSLIMSASLEQASTDPSFSLVARYESGNSRASIEGTQTYFAEYPNRCALTGELDIAERHASIEAICDGSNAKLSMEVTPDKYILSTEQNAWEKLPARAEGYLTYSIGEVTTVTINAVVDSKIYQLTTKCDMNAKACNVHLVWDELSWEDGMTFDTTDSQLVWTYYLKQNLVSKIPAAVNLKEVFTWKEDVKSYSFHLDYTDGEPIDFTLSWNKNDESVFGDISINHNVIEMSPVPHQFTVSMDRVKKGRLAVRGSIEGRDVEFVAIALPDSISFTHNFELLTSMINIPQEVTFTVNLKPATGMVSFIFGEKIAKVMYSINSDTPKRTEITFTQTLIANQPHSIVFVSTHQLTTDEDSYFVSGSLQLSLDEKVYKIDTSIDHKLSGCVNQMVITIPRHSLAYDATLNRDDQSFTFNHIQDIFEDIPREVHASVRGNLEEEQLSFGGSFKTNTLSLRKIDFSFRQPSENSAEMTVVHNQRGWSKYVGRNSVFTATWTSSPTNPSVELKAVMDGTTQKMTISATLTDDEYAVEMSHNIALLESNQVPTSFRESLSGLVGSRKIISITYTVNGREKTFTAYFSKNTQGTVSVSIDQNISKYVNVFNTKLITPKKMTMQFEALEDQSYKISTMVKAKGRQTAELVYRVVCDNISQDISFVFSHDMDDVVHSAIPNSAKFTLLRDSEHPLTIHLSYDEVTYDLTLNYEFTNPYTVSLTFDQNSPLTELISMPRHYFMSESVTLGEEITIVRKLEMDDNHFQTTISGRVVDDNTVQINAAYTGPKNANLNADVHLMRSNGNYSATTTGTYRLPNQASTPFIMGVSGKYDLETYTITFNMFHNVQELKQYFVPNQIDYKQSGRFNDEDKALSFEYILTISELYHAEETFASKITDNQFVFSGTSTSVGMMLNPDLADANRIYKYAGKAWYVNIKKNMSANWQLTGRLNNEEVTNMDFSVSMSKRDETITIEGVSKFEQLNELGVPKNVMYTHTVRSGSVKEEFSFTNFEGIEERATGIVTWRQTGAIARLSSNIRSWKMPFRSAVLQASYTPQNHEVSLTSTVDGNNIVSVESTTSFEIESLPRSIKHTGSITYKTEKIYDGTFDFAQSTLQDFSIETSTKILERKLVYSQTVTHPSGLAKHDGSWSYSDGERIVAAAEHSTSYKFGEISNVIRHTCSATYMSDEIYSCSLDYNTALSPMEINIGLTINALQRKVVYSLTQSVSDNSVTGHESFIYSDATQTYLSYIKNVDQTIKPSYSIQHTERLVNNIIQSQYVPSIYENNMEVRKEYANIHRRWDDKSIDFVYNENGNGEYTLRHNIAYLRDTFKIPEVISGVYQMGDNNLTFNIVLDPYKFNFVYHNNQYNTEIYYSGRHILSLSGSFSLDPILSTSHAILIPIMRLHYNAVLSAQGDLALSEKSGIKFVLTDKSLRTGRSMEIDAFARRTELPLALFTITSDLERIDPIDFGVKYEKLDACEFSIHYDDYRINMNGDNRNFSIDVSLPENMEVNQASFTIGCVGEIESEFKSQAIARWNQVNVIRATANITNDDEKEINLSFEHPFKSCANKIVITHHGHSTSRVKSYHTHVIVDGKDTHISTTYRGTLPNLSGSHNLKVEIAHPYEDTFVPNRFVTSGKISVYEGLYDSRWTITADDEDKVVLNKIYQKTADGATFEFEWKQPSEQLIVKELSMYYAYSPGIPVTLTMDLLHNAVCKYVPSQTKNVISISLQENDYKSTWSMYNGDNELVYFLNDWVANEDGFSANMEFRQPHEELLLTKFNFNTEAIARETYQLFTTHTELNAHLPVETRFENTVDARNNVVAANTESTVSIGQDIYSFATEQSWGGSIRNGYKYLYNSDINLPQDTQILSITIPADHKIRNLAFWRNQNAHLRSTYETSAMEAPVGVDFMYRTTDDETQATFTGNFSLTDHPTDIYHKITIETLKNGHDINFASKSPLIGINNLDVRFKYNTNGKLVLQINNGEDEPVVIKGDFRKVIGDLKNYASQSWLKKLTPSISFIFDKTAIENGKDSFIGFKVNDVPYTIHALTFTENGERAVLVLQSRKGVEETEIARITAHLENENTLRLTATANNFVSAFSRALLHVAGEEVTTKMADTVEDIVELLKVFKNSLEGNHMVVDSVHKNIDSAIDKISTMQQEYTHFIDDLNEYTVRSLEESENEVERSIRRYISILEYIRTQLQEIVLGPIKDITHDYYMEAAEQFTVKIRRQMNPVKRAFDMVNAGDLLMELIEEGVLKTVYFVEKNVEASLTGIEPAIANLVEVTDTSLVLDIPLSIQIDLVPLPTYAEVLMWVAQSSFSTEIDMSIKKLYSLTDDYYKLRSFIYKPLDELVPPYKGHAEITSFKHFRTFDGLQYEFDSSCASTHVLARDFRDGDFTVLLKYGSTNPAIAVRSALSDGGMQYIEMRQDYSIVDEDGNHVDLPISYEGLTVKRTGDFVRLSTNMGLAVTCNFKNALCHIDISAFYFGSTAGLAGTFNNEIFDDFSLPSETVSSEVEELAVSWSVPGDICRVTNTYMSCEERYNEECEALFTDKSSLLRSCFPVVDPTPYLEMCKKDTCSDDAASTCASVATYQRRCMLSGAPLALPSQCTTCDSADGNALGVNPEIKPVTSADVVFVIEKSSCMNIRKMRELLDGIHDNLDSTVGSIRYAVVGFGGEPVSHTFGGAIFKQAIDEVHASHVHNFNNRDILTALLKSGVPSDVGQPDALSAISAATQLPFQAGASRTVLLFTCDECSTASESNIEEVKSQLKEQNIVLHHLRSEKIVSGKKKAYGFNNDRVFARNNNIDRENIKTSKDVCTDLASVTNGSVWNTRMFARRSVSDLVEMISGEVSRGAQLAQTHTCKCVAGPNGPISVCSA